MAAAYNYQVDQNRDWPRLIQLFTDCSETTPIDLTGYKADLTAKKALSDVTAAMHLTTENGGITIDGVNGKILWVAAAAVTGAMTGEYFYELRLIPPTGGPISVLKGMINIDPKVEV